MINLLSNRRRLAIILAGLFTISAIALAVYGLFELRGLRARVHTLEYAKGEEYFQQEEQNKISESEKIKYDVLSKTTKTIRVEEVDYNGYDSTQEKVYTDKKVYEYKLRVTNGTTYAYDYVTGAVKGKTKSGSLITPYDYYMIHPDDRKGKDFISLAPGGSSEIYLYLLADENIVDLYFGYDGGV